MKRKARRGPAKVMAGPVGGATPTARSHAGKGRKTAEPGRPVPRGAPEAEPTPAPPAASGAVLESRTAQILRLASGVVRAYELTGCSEMREARAAAAAVELCAEVEQLRLRLTQSTAARRRVEALLREVSDNGRNGCPCCEREGDHRDGCRLAIALLSAEW